MFFLNKLKKPCTFNNLPLTFIFEKYKYFPLKEAYLCSIFQVCYAKELKEGFVEYTEQVVKLMVPLLKFYFHDDILLTNPTVKTET